LECGSLVPLWTSIDLGDSPINSKQRKEKEVREAVGTFFRSTVAPQPTTPVEQESQPQSLKRDDEMEDEQ
jgi:hypothetical protein